MTRTLLTLFLWITFVDNLTAQNWQTVRAGQSYFFADENNDSVRGIRIDRIDTMGIDFEYYNFNTTRADSNCTPGYEGSSPFAPSWAGRKTIVRPDGWNVFFNKFMDSIFINTIADSGDSWLMYRFVNGDYIQASISNFSEDSIYGAPDSIKEISLSVKDIIGVPINHPLNTSVLKLSKANGFVKTLAWYDFPEDSMSWELSEDAPLTGRKMYDWDIGDEIEIEDWYQATWQSPRYYTWTLYKYIDKWFSVDNDTVFYKISRRIESWWPPSGSLSFDTIIEFYKDLDAPITSRMPEEAHWLETRISLRGLQERQELYQYSIPVGPIEDSCWGVPFEPPQLTYAYIAGIAYLTSSKDVDGGWWEESLYYYKKDSEQFGFPHGVNDQAATLPKIDVYPNPFHSTTTFSIPSNIRKPTLVIYDLMGKELRRISNIPNQYTLHRGDLPNGLFFFSVLEENIPLANGKIITY